MLLSTQKATCIIIVTNRTCTGYKEPQRLLLDHQNSKSPTPSYEHEVLPLSY